ncbi:MAG: class I SAM-dependent methyltransferase [Acidimicrobiia bacterium]
MSRFEAAFCRSAPWRFAARRVIHPWALQGTHPVGDVLEIGAGSGAMAAELLATHPDAHMTVTDFDQEMVEAASQRLTGFADKAATRQADATALPFEDDSFDFVLSWIMLHHTVEWEKALAESVRVSRPGGQVVGYDLLNTAPLRALHQAEGARFRMMRFGELRATVRDLPVAQAILTPSLGRFAVRFTLRK